MLRLERELSPFDDTLSHMQPYAGGRQQVRSVGLSPVHSILVISAVAQGGWK